MPPNTIETVRFSSKHRANRVQPVQVPLLKAVELYGQSSQDTGQNVHLAKMTAARKASKATRWNTCGACCSLNRFWQVCFFTRMIARRSTGKQKSNDENIKSIKSRRTSFFQTHPRLRNAILQDLADTPTQNRGNQKVQNKHSEPRPTSGQTTHIASYWQQW